MAYTYLLDLYTLVEKEQARAKAAQGECGDNSLYHQGRSDLLEEFKVYLSDQLDDKLPRRIRKRLQSG